MVKKKSCLLLDITSQYINSESMCLKSFVLAGGDFLTLSAQSFQALKLRAVLLSSHLCVRSAS